MLISRTKTSIITAMLLFCALTVHAAEMMKAGGSVTVVKSMDEFNRALQSGLYVVAYFSSPTCGPCKAFHDTYYAMAKEYTDVLFLEVSYGTFAGSETLLNKYGVRSFPTFVFFDKTGVKKSAFSGTSDRTKAKIAGEIVQLKDSGCSPSMAPYQSQPQPTPQQSMPQPMSQPMPQPMVQQQALQQPRMQPVQAPVNQVQGQPLVQGNMTYPQNAPLNIVQQQPMGRVTMQQPVVQQEVQPVITYHDVPGNVTSAPQGNPQPVMANPKRPVRNGRMQRGKAKSLGRRQRQRMNTIEYQ